MLHVVWDISSSGNTESSNSASCDRSWGLSFSSGNTPAGQRVVDPGCSQGGGATPTALQQKLRAVEEEQQQQKDNVRTTSAPQQHQAVVVSQSWRGKSQAGQQQPAHHHVIFADNSNSSTTLAGGVAEDEGEEDADADGEEGSHGEAADQQQNAPNWVVGGVLPSVGSSSHDQGTCKPCHYIFANISCKNGQNCTFCHFKHSRKEWNRPSKKKRVRCKRNNLVSELMLENPLGSAPDGSAQRTLAQGAKPARAVAAGGAATDGNASASTAEAESQARVAASTAKPPPPGPCRKKTILSL